jgi:DtxR family transcriptional regulator, Mn-dependent transcriptional regulator
MQGTRIVNESFNRNAVEAERLPISIWKGVKDDDKIEIGISSRLAAHIGPSGKYYRSVEILLRVNRFRYSYNLVPHSTQDTIWFSVKITISKENYLKTIAEAEGEGEPVIAATLARWLNVSAPAVTMAIKRLKRDSLIRVARDGQLSLTGSGRDIANRLLHRHHLIERMLTEIFGMEWYKVHDEAEQLEHAVSADFERRLVEKLGTGEACPHGNRVERDTPQDRRSRGWRPLDEVPPEAEATVVSVFERDRRLLEYLNGIGIHPGAVVKMLAANYDDTLTLRIARKPVQLGKSAAGKIWVAFSG